MAFAISGEWIGDTTLLGANGVIEIDLFIQSIAASSTFQLGVNFVFLFHLLIYFVVESGCMCFYIFANVSRISDCVFILVKCKSLMLRTANMLYSLRYLRKISISCLSNIFRAYSPINFFSSTF